MINKTILVHLPAYRDPELIPTIQDALANAQYPERIRFGICRQYNPEDGFDDLTEYKNDHRFKINEMLYTEAKGLAYARAIINDKLLDDEDFVLQLDSHHRFTKNWDSTLISWYNELSEEGYNPVIGGYLPLYNPFDDPGGRIQEPWLSEAACFYPFGTIFIRPTGVPNWQTLTKPYPARFLSGHFAFGSNKWARDVRHDPNIFFAGEEINLTVRSFTNGYDLFHPHKVIIWHATMREERNNMLVWDDMSKRGDNTWWKGNESARSRIRQLLGVEEKTTDFGEYGLGTVRSLRDYEKYAGIHFQKRAFQQYTIDNRFAPNPHPYKTEKDWEDSFINSFYYLVNIDRHLLPGSNYAKILVSFDDKDGIGIHQTYITDQRLQDFLTDGKSIHYEEMFLTDKVPDRVVYWAVDETQGWAERVEIKI
tara:strand:- start:5034 stop:6302 length:1269 start_codon:yes stop_codon:yes gene_type:complete